MNVNIDKRGIRTSENLTIRDLKIIYDALIPLLFLI